MNIFLFILTKSNSSLMKEILQVLPFNFNDFVSIDVTSCFSKNVNEISVLINR